MRFRQRDRNAYRETYRDRRCRYRHGTRKCFPVRVGTSLSKILSGACVQLKVCSVFVCVSLGVGIQAQKITNKTSLTCVLALQCNLAHTSTCTTRIHVSYPRTITIICGRIITPT